jgi:hypothetical protein
MGQDAEEVLRSTNITEDQREKYDTVVAKFEEFFKVRRNVIFERVRFNNRNQKEGESIEQYLTALYALVETCEYGPLTEEMLRDRLVVRIRDRNLSERLQTFPDLTHEKAKRETRQRAAVKEQHQELKGDGSHKNPIIIARLTSDKAGVRTGPKGGKQHRGGAARARACGKTQGKTGTARPLFASGAVETTGKMHNAQLEMQPASSAIEKVITALSAFLGRWQPWLHRV